MKERRGLRRTEINDRRNELFLSHSLVTAQQTHFTIGFLYFLSEWISLTLYRWAIQKYVNLTTSTPLFPKFPMPYVKHNKTTKHKLETSSLLGFDAASMGTWFPMFRRKVSLSSSRAQRTIEDESHTFQAHSVISQMTKTLSYTVAKVSKLPNTITFCVCLCRFTAQIIPQMFYPLRAENFYQLMK